VKATHTPRIIPGHQGGRYAPENTVEAPTSVCDKKTALHPMWHYANWRLWGKTEDLCAWKGLAGQIGKEEIIAEMHAEGVRRAVETNRKNGTGLFDPKVREMSGTLGHETRLKKKPTYLQGMNEKSVAVWTGQRHDKKAIEKMKAAKPKGSYSNKGRTPESRQVITMTNLDGRTETHPHWEWREMGVRYDRAGVKRKHDKGWQFPHCPLEQVKS
jgi:hypothetical protein